MGNLEREISDLRVSQAKTGVLLNTFISKVDSFIDESNCFRKEMMSNQTETARRLSETALVLQLLVKKVEDNSGRDIPQLRQEQTKTSAVVAANKWLLQAIVGITIVASMGGVFANMSACSNGVSSDGAILFFGIGFGIVTLLLVGTLVFTYLKGTWSQVQKSENKNENSC